MVVRKSKWEDVTPEELAEARRYSMRIDWSPEDEVFIASFPDVPFVRTHGETREKAFEQGEEVIVAWLTAMRDAGLPVTPPSTTVRDLDFPEPTAYDAETIRRIRRALDVSQPVFAALLNVKVTTVRSWEQGQRMPDGASVRLLNIAERQPQVLFDLSNVEEQARSA